MEDKKIEEKDNAKKENEIAKAKQLLEEDRQKRLQACAEEIQAILSKYNCQLTPTITVSAK